MFEIELLGKQFGGSSVVTRSVGGCNRSKRQVEAEKDECDREPYVGRFAPVRIVGSASQTVTDLRPIIR